MRREIQSNKGIAPDASSYQHARSLATMSTLPRQMPRKQSGQGLGPRRFNGKMLDVRAAADLIGTTEKLIRARVSRRLIPFHRLGGRIVFIKTEIREYHRRLPGCGLEEALANIAQRTRTNS